MPTLISASDLPLLDDFDTDVPAGDVIGTSTGTGHLRHGVDEEGVISIDHRAARIRPLVRPGWARSALAYGPFEAADGLVGSVVLLNGRNGSENLDPWPAPADWTKQWIRGTQSDGPAGRMLRVPRSVKRDRPTRRLRAARVDSRLAADERSDLNLAISWTPSLDLTQPESGPSVIVRANGPDNAELCLAESGRIRSVAPLLELPMRLLFLVTGGTLAVFAALDDQLEGWPSPTYLGSLALPPAARPGTERWLSIQQRALGQVGWGMDTRVREVRVDQLTTYPSLAELERGAEIDSPCAIARSSRRLDDPIVLADDFRERSPDLSGATGVGPTWRHVVGTRKIQLDDGGATVGPPVPAPTGRLARLFRPSGQRTAYVVEWDGRPGSISAQITPPGTGRGEGHAGRGGLILFQDLDNYLIVNNWLDDEFGGASVSCFRRIGGHEEVYDAVWTNVGQRITWGARHELTLAFDRSGFTAYVDREAVLDREYRDVYPTCGPVEVNAVGLCTNWEFGDDTGTRFEAFRARARSAR